MAEQTNDLSYLEVSLYHDATWPRCPLLPSSRPPAVGQGAGLERTRERDRERERRGGERRGGGGEGERQRNRETDGQAETYVERETKTHSE